MNKDEKLENLVKKIDVIFEGEEAHLCINAMCNVLGRSVVQQAYRGSSPEYCISVIRQQIERVVAANLWENT